MEVTDSALAHLRRVTAMPDVSGTRYELEQEIGRGGMGIVYAAKDLHLGRRVALKILDATFAAEAALIAQLEHPSIVPVYEAGTLPDGQVFYAMKLITGERLDNHLAGGPVLADRLRIIGRVGEALAFAHARGVLHRDLKPQNVMVGAFGEVYVMDWGIAKIAGTPGFRAPDAHLDHRSDIYALGALLRFVLPASAPRPLSAIAERAMKEDPAARYESVPEFLADIDRFQEGSAVRAWPEPWWHGLRRFWVRNAAVMAVLAAYIIVKFIMFFLSNR